MSIILRIENLRKEYENALPLKKINLEVKKGEVISIIGPSGTGKSTFLRCINRLEEPSGGKIFLDGENILSRDYGAEKIRQKIGMIFQNFNLFPHLTVIENVTVAPIELKKIPKIEAYEEAQKLLKTVGLSEKILNYPDELSGGQQQRVAIVRALMMKPEILLFDEPTSALDPTMVGEVLAVIRQLSKENLTMLIVTHEMNFAREVADRILFFAEGEIYEEGTPQEIFENPQKPLTIEFINKLKIFHYEIFAKDFDLPGLQGGIWNFSEKYGLGNKNLRNLQLCCEETIFEFLNNCYAEGDEVKIFIDIIYSESTRQTEIKISGGGKKFNPLEFEDDFEHLGVKILTNIAKEIKYFYEDNLNKITIQI